MNIILLAVILLIIGIFIGFFAGYFHRLNMDKLGKKYGFNPATCAINTMTGEVKQVEKRGKDKK